MEFKTVKLGEISINGKGNYGIAASAVDFSSRLPTYLRITDISDEGYIISESLKSVDEINSQQYMLQVNDIVFARTGNSTGKSYFFDGKDGELIYAGFLIKFSLDPEKVNPKYIRFYTLSEEYKGWVKSFSTGSTRGNINAKSYANMSISLPNRNYQNFVVNILSSIEDKILLNKTIISNLEQISQTLFKHWFVDFEFPNEEGKPYKSSGGEMVESEFGEIPNQFSLGILSDIYDNFDSKRKPLSKMDRMDREKIYPYYGAASLMDYVDEYLFKGRYLLLGEDGTVQTQEGKPILQFIEGKFWVNNHAHVMQGKNYFSTEYLYVLLRNTPISNIVTGAVQPKISQKNLNNIKIFLPPQDVLMEFQSIISSVFDKIFLLKRENQRLQELRDTLLPKLLSGEIEIPEDLEV